MTRVVSILTLTLAVVLAGALAPGGTRAAGAATADRGVDDVLTAYAVNDVDLPALAAEARRSGRIALPVYGRVYDLELELHSVRAADMVRYSIDVAGVVEREELPPVGTYRGRVAGDPESDLRLTLTEALLTGYVRVGGETYFVDPARRFDLGAPAGRIVSYRADDLVAPPQSPADPGGVEVFQQQLLDGVLGQAVSSNPARVLELATEADGEFSQANGGTGAANTLIEGIVNQLDGLLVANLNLGVRLSAQFAYGNPATDPYTSTYYGHGPSRFGPFQPNEPCTVSDTGLWEQFRNYWNLNRAAVRRDAAVLFSGKNLKLCPTAKDPVELELYGTAGDSPTICQPADRGYVLMERYPTNSAGLMAHELGHSLGSAHDVTSLCPGAAHDPIMCGVVQSASDTYSQSSLNQINSNLNQNGQCLAPADIELPVAAGTTYMFSAPTTPNVGRVETITITNTGATPLTISNPGSLVSGSCFQQVTSPSSVIQGGQTSSFQVRLQCGTQGYKTGTVTIQSDDPDEGTYQFLLRGQVSSFVYDVRLTTTYAPGSSGARQSYESTQAHPTTTLTYYFDPNLGSFEQRPGGACSSGIDNPTYLKMRLGGNANITACTFQFSWDPQPFTCSQGLIDAFNARQDIVVNTDDVLTDLSDCRFKEPLSFHAPYGGVDHARVTFFVSGGEYERRVYFTKRSEVLYSAVSNDTYVDEAQPDTNFGQVQYLQVSNATGNRHYSFLQAVAGPQVPVRSARLYLTVQQGPISGLLVYKVPNIFFWGESTLTWNNWQGYTGGAGTLLQAFGNLPTGLWVQLNLDSGVVGTTSAAVGVMLQTYDTSLYRRFNSGEYYYDKPYFVVTTEH